MSGWTSLLTAGDLEELREALRRGVGHIPGVGGTGPPAAGAGEHPAGSVRLSVPMLVRLER